MRHARGPRLPSELQSFAMNNGSITTEFEVLAQGDLALVRVHGPGICKECGRFETLLREVENMGFSTILIDLGNCARLDSTFAGGFLRLATRTEKRKASGKPLRVVIGGAREQVRDLLDTLCLSNVFETVEIPDDSLLTPIAVEDRDLPREEIMALTLDSHERLARLDDANAQRFAHLLPILRAELAKARKADSAE